MAEPLLQLHNIVKHYQIGEHVTQVLKQVCLQVAAGELLAIVGASGSGKSTLMNIIGLLDQADGGEYRLANQAINQLNPNQLAALRNQKIGFVFQQFNLLPRINAKQNVALPLIYRNIPTPEIEPLVMHALEKVAMQDFAHHRPTQLSGGQQQRVAIARALVGEPQVILADEPTGALDSRTGSQVMELFLHLHKEGRTLILVTHDEHIARQCQRRITLADGQIVGEISQ